MSEKLITLQVWAGRVFGENGPNKDTLRRWCRDTKIFPAPKKIGRAYYVAPDAQYVDNYNSSDFMRRVRDATTTQQ